MALSKMLSSSQLIENVKELSELSGEFYFYEPRERCINSGSGYPLTWESVSPNEEDSLSLGDLDRYSLLLCASLGYSATKISPEEAISRICEKRLWQRMAILWVSDHCLSGDYCGAAYTASNCRVLLSCFSGPEAREAYGSHGAKTIAIDPRYLSLDLLENLQSLEQYPLLDEDDCGKLETELQDEAWENWAERDFSSAVEKRLAEFIGDDIADSICGIIPDNTWLSFFRSLMEATNTYWESQGSPDQWLDIDRLINGASEEALAEFVADGLSALQQAALAPSAQAASEPAQAVACAS